MTSRRFAQLCAQGKLEWKHEPSNSGVIYHEYLYVEGDENKPVDAHTTSAFDGQLKEVTQKVVARVHTETEWHSPDYFDNFEFD